MKKTILFLAMCVLVISSCSKVERDFELNDSDNLNIINLVPSTTRAAINTLDALKASTAGFKVNATTSNVVGNDWFLNGHNYKWNTVTNAWDIVGTAKEWPESPAAYPMNFYSYFPITADGFTMTATDKTAMSASITVQSAGANQVDFLAAKSVVGAVKPASGKVPVDFKHIMSKFNFAINTGTKTNAFVNHIVINNVKPTAAYNYLTETWADATGDASDYVYSEDVKAVFKNNTTDIDALGGGSLMLLPQTLVEWDGIAEIDAAADTWEVMPAQSHISMLYRTTIQDGAAAAVNSIGAALRNQFPHNTKYAVGTPEYLKYSYVAGADGAAGTFGTYNGGLYIKVGFVLAGANLTWTPGKGYKYNIAIGTDDASGGIYLSAYLFDDEGNNTRIPVGGGDIIIPPGPVTGGDIGVEVDVNGWDDAVIGGF